MFDALRVPAVRLLLIGNLVSGFGSWLLVVAVPYHVFQLTGSASATGLTLAAESVPALLVGPVAGALVDRWDLRTVLIVTDLVCAGALLGIPLADRPSRIGWLYAALVVENLGLVFLRPAARALLPAVVGTGPALAGANSLFAVNGGIVRLAGPPLGAVLLTWFGLPALVLADLASYLVAALAVALIGHRRAVGDAPARGGVVAGLSFLRRSRVLSGLLLLSFTFWSANAVFSALLIPFMTTRFGHHPGVLGAQLSALGAGYLLGGPLAGRLVRDRPPALPLVLSLAGVGGCFTVLANAPTALVAVLATGAAGLPGASLLVVIETTIQRATPTGLRGRVGAAFFASDAAAALTGALIGAWLGDGVLTASAGVILLAAVSAPAALGGCSVRTIFVSVGSATRAKFAAQRPNPADAAKSSLRRRIWAGRARS